MDDNKIRNKFNDVVNDLDFYKLFDIAEKGRWKMTDLPWDKLDKASVHPDVVKNIVAIAKGELTTYSATHAFMDKFAGDIDFTQWLSVWFYEETKHPSVLLKWLSHFDVKVDYDFVIEGREIMPMNASKLHMLCFNIISEIFACNMYLALHEMIEEPVLLKITQYLAADEMRHSIGFENYCKREIENSDDIEAAKLSCVQALFFALEREIQEHPVLLTMEETQYYYGQQERIKNISKKIINRFSKMLGIELGSNIDEVYSKYRELRRKHRKSQKSQNINAKENQIQK